MPQGQWTSWKVKPEGTSSCSLALRSDTPPLQLKPSNSRETERIFQHSYSILYNIIWLPCILSVSELEKLKREKARLSKPIQKVKRVMTFCHLICHPYVPPHKVELEWARFKYIITQNQVNKVSTGNERVFFLKKKDIVKIICNKVLD